MFSAGRTQYKIKTCLSSDVEQLEEILNSMSKEGWDLYNLYETEIDDEFVSACIFIRELQEDDLNSENDFDSFGFKSKMQKIVSFQKDTYELCKYIQKKLKEKRKKISQIKALIDSTDESLRGDLNLQMSKLIKEQDELKKSLTEMTSPESMVNKLNEEKVKIQLSNELMGLVDPDLDANLIAKTVKIRQKLTEELGYIIPRIKFEEEEELQANEFLIQVRGVTAVKDIAFFGYKMYFESSLNLTKYPKNSIKTIDYITQKPVIWIEENITKDFWQEGLDACDYIARLLEYVSIKYVSEIFDYNDINRYIDNVGNENLFLIENIIPEFLSVSEIKYILTSLIKEKVSIKDINFIFEKLNDLSDDSNKENLLEKVRISLARTISRDLADENCIINAYEISSESLNFLKKELDKDKTTLKIKESKFLPLINKIKKIQAKLSQDKDLIIIAPCELRHVIHLAFSNYLNNIKIIAREEISYEYILETIKKI